MEPILFYTSIRKLQNNPIENVHLSFCKQLLGVQKQTTNTEVLLELWEDPLTIFAQQNAITDWVRIVNKMQCINMHDS